MENQLREIEAKMKREKLKKKLLAKPWLLFLCPLDDCRFFCNSEGYINNKAATHLKKVHNLNSAIVAKNISKYRFKKSSSQVIRTNLKAIHTDDHYALLGIPKNASKMLIRKAYIKMVKINHTDKLHNVDRHIIAEKEEIFKRIVTAYNALTMTFESIETTKTDTETT